MDRITLQTGAGEQTISRHIFGHFSEHLGRCIYEGYWVGEDSPIPNTRGIRNDVVEALRKLRVPNLRWPGGCFADTYHWMDGVGPREQRPAMVNDWWGSIVETNHFGTHEFMDLCEQVGCEPYICGNVGSGTVREMAQWVEYLTFDGQSPMARLRADNGRPEPWTVRLWGVGNENWGCGGNMRPEFYADLYRQYACYCREYGDNKLFRIAGGSASENWHWTRVLMNVAGSYMDGLSFHHYIVPGTWEKKGSATSFTEQEYITTIRKSWAMDDLVTRHGRIMDEYDPKKRVAMVVDEWGIWLDVEPDTNPAFLYQQSSMRDALVAGMHLHIFANHSDRVRMANLAQTVNVLQSPILTDGPKMLLTPTYHVFDMMKVHQDATFLPTQVHAERWAPDGEPLEPISAAASRDADGHVHLSVCNFRHDTPAKVEVALEGASLTKAGGTILSADDVQAHNTYDHPDAVTPVEFDGASIERDTLKLKLPPASLAVVRLT